ncbi:guanine nucleotide-binding protein-like 3-like protein isoform X2 [Heterodontus francisci]|uniref:guanine nucleotide-binding protein-like 3-like protein isoform X2 n=1 Tax=Heterodontus francisci TaxID=7792 RepID=UPI00355AE9AA
MARGGEWRLAEVTHVGRKQKLRRSAKALKRSSGQDQKQLKKDPGVPNVASFKERVAREAEKRKQRMQVLKERQKAARAQGMSKRRSLEGLQQDAQKRQQEFEQMESNLQDLQSNLKLASENSRKSYYREFKKVIEASDVILEVLDSRDPMGCRCPQVEQAVLQSGANKRIILVLNKIDLVAKDIIEKWLKYLRNELPTVAFKASTQLQNKNLHRSRVPVEQAGADLLQSSACVGAENLMRLLGNYCRSRDLKTAITVGVVGFPNVGKSSLINSLKRARACNVGATPGVTKCLQEIHLDKHIKLLDCPGIVMATSSSDAAIILRNCVKIEQLADPVEPVAAILRRCNKQQVMQHYNIPEFQDTLQFLALLARRLGRLKQGGLPDHEQAAKTVLSDWTSGKICYFTHPPESHTLPTHISAEIVSELGKAFDMEELEKGNQESLSKIVSAPEESGICVETSGLTSGQGELPPSCEMEEDVLTRESWAEDENTDHAQQLQSGTMTVTFRGRSDKTRQEVETVSRLPDLQVIRDIDPLRQGQALRAANKRRRRLQKRADKLATKLSSTLTAALDLSLSD